MPIIVSTTKSLALFSVPGRPLSPPPGKLLHTLYHPLRSSSGAQTGSFNKYLSTCFVPRPVVGSGDLSEARHLSLPPSKEDRGSTSNTEWMRVTRILPGEAMG